MALIETKNLVKIYMMGETKISALKGVDLTIQAGEFIAITGPSGSGKSTLMHLLGCLDTPTEGTYYIDQEEISKMNKEQLAHVRNKKIGFVFQQFYLLPDFTAQNNVALPRLYAGDSEDEANKHAATLLDLVGLADRMHHYPYQLSGGQQQRVAIARALVNNPKIIFADEPTGNLDSVTGNIIMELFTKLNTQQHVTIILVTHEPPIAARARRIITLLDGNIVSDKKTT